MRPAIKDHQSVTRSENNYASLKSIGFSLSRNLGALLYNISALANLGFIRNKKPSQRMLIDEFLIKNLSSFLLNFNFL